MGFVEDIAGYHEEKLEVKERNRYKEFRNTTPDINWKLEISLNLIGKIILEISKSLCNLHSTNIIHGDVKPGNVLITKNGVNLIDSLELSDGMQSPAMTKGWAAPEQIIGDKICVSTDQYPIGIMFLYLLKGVMYGEEAKIWIPSGGTNLECHKLFRNPGVYIDPEIAPVKAAHLNEWKNFVESLQLLLEQKPLQNKIRIPLSFGRLISGKNSKGNITPCWLID